MKERELTPVLVPASVRREQIREKVVESLKSSFPFVGSRYTLDVQDVRVHPADIGPEEYKKALLTARTISEPVRGTLLLKDTQSGKVISKAPNFNLMQLPYFTDHHTFVLGGNQYNVSNQLRMKPGVYTRKRRNETLEASFNLAKGSNFRVSMDPEGGLFNMEYGSTHIPLYPVLNKLGVPDAEISRHWNPDLVRVNREATAGKEDKVIGKLYNVVSQDPTASDPNEQIEQIRKEYDRTVLDPRVTKMTLGHEYDKVNPDVILKASQKLLRAYNENIDFDERDSIAFKHLKGVDDFLAERIALESRTLRNKFLTKLERGKGGLDAIPYSPYTKTIKNFLVTSTLSGTPAQINPVEILDQAARVTSLGEGGISDIRAIPTDARKLHTSSITVLDPVRTPESHKTGIDLRSAIFTSRDRDGNIYTYLKNARTGKFEHVPVDEMASKVVAFPKQDIRGQVDVIAENRIQARPAKDVDYIIPTTHAMYSPATNLIPFLDSIDGNRQTMGAKMMGQALPLVHSEPPLVQVKSYAGSSYDTMEEEIGSQIVPRSPVSGQVTRVRDGFVYIRPSGDKTAAEPVKIPVYENFPLASKTYLDNPLLVKPGDEVKKGQILAGSPFLEDGHLALGTNLKTAYIPYHGLNSNDAVVISEGASKKLTSQHMYRVGQDLDSDTNADRTKHQAYFGTKYTQDVYGKLDEAGVVKPGEKVRKGDILVAAVQKSALSPEAQMLGKLHKSLVKPYRDASLAWEKEAEGTVVDVARSGNKIRMTVKTEEPMQVGDKLCFSLDTEILTTRGWRAVIDITMADWCYTLNPEGKICLEQPTATHLYPSAGSLYELYADDVCLRVTPNHNLLVQKNGKFSLTQAREILGKKAVHRKSGEWGLYGPVPNKFALMNSSVVWDTTAWGRFMGVFLASGNYADHGIIIPYDTREDRWEKLQAIRQCDLKFEECDKALFIDCLEQPALEEYFKKHSQTRRVPRELFEHGSNVAKEFLHGLLGPAWAKTKTSLVMTTLTKKLADELQRVALHAGYAADIADMNPIYYVRFTKNVFPAVKNGRKNCLERIIPSTEQVVGITVPSGILYVRIRGKTVFTGNSGRYGDKGVVSAIIPDDQMIQDESGKPVDLLLSSASVVSRINPAQVLETALGKVAEKTGRPIAIENFADRDNVKYVKEELKKHGLKDKETVYDPMTGKHIPDVLVGPKYTLKLFKTTDTNFAARGVEDYDVNQQPSSGGPTGSKGIGRMVFNALLAHDARNFLRESTVLKSQKNDAWWRAYQLGLPLPELKTSFSYDKFGAMLAGSGIKMNKSGDYVTLGPMTDKDVGAASSGAIKNPLLVRAKDLQPERGGLFDPVLTGGTDGKKWSHLDLNEPVVNPIFEKPVRTLLGMKQAEFEATLREEGGKGIRKRLSGIDVASREKELLDGLDTMRAAERDQSIKELKYLRTLKRNDIRPEDAYVLSKVPVIPPVFRPIVPGKKGDLQVSDANYLYRDTILANDMLPKTEGLPEAHKDARSNLYNSVKALYGTAEPLSPQLKARNVRGFIDRIVGGGVGPKFGYFQSKLVTKKQDLSGRGTIIPDPTIGMDEVGLPEDMLWGMFRPFVMKNMVQKGYSAMDANKMIDDKHPLAKDILFNETKNRPVYINRAPSLYRYNILAAYPRPVPGKTIRVHEMLAPIVSGDFDGDAMQVFTPVTPEAVAEARNLTLPHMLLSDQEKHTLTKAAPHQESVTGLYLATSAKDKGPIRKFSSKAEAMAAYNRGEITLGTPVEIKEK